MIKESMHKPRIAVVVPCYNEEEVLRMSNARLTALLREMIESGLIAPDSYIMYGDDGSIDSTWEIISRLANDDVNVEGLRLAGNVGHQNMLLALHEAVCDKCDAVISVDADLQDDISVIPEMVREFISGSDVVLGVRGNRGSDTWFKRTTAATFYKFIKMLGVRSVSNHADFRLMSRKAARALLEYDERNMYLRGIVCSLGFKQSSVYYDRMPRQAGDTKYPFGKMFNLAVDGITSFSIRPVRLIFIIGLIFMMISLAILIYVLVNYFEGNTVPGWSSLILSIWFCSGVVLMSLGIMGEYIGKIYMEVKKRPRYIVDKNTMENKRPA